MRIYNIKGFMDFALPKSVTAITLAPFGVYARKWARKDNEIMNEEKIHWAQQMETLIIFFYLIYIIEYLIKFPRYKSRAYYAISFEREAKRYSHVDHYLKYRKPWAWVYYIFNAY